MHFGLLSYTNASSTTSVLLYSSFSTKENDEKQERQEEKESEVGRSLWIFADKSEIVSLNMKKLDRALFLVILFCCKFNLHVCSLFDSSIFSNIFYIPYELIKSLFENFKMSRSRENRWNRCGTKQSFKLDSHAA